ncbi:MAG: phosphoribosylformylglycinamidine cyclo-ligase [Spirochaetales bacterium]|nr:phosphoribosylformylglycinamidine cyclo-ligase [Spirochaetales bacterium]
MESPKTYAEAGVDIEKGDRFARFIGSIKSKAVSGSLGGFAGGIEIDTQKYTSPVLMSCTDGVGTKLLVAQTLKTFDTVGIDLVAMSVNDLIVCGAEPLVFLDYIACGGIDEPLLESLIHGIVAGCEDAECTLAGGETAEMPDLYKNGDFDLAGFCVGIVDKENILPKKQKITAGDRIFGLPSSGIHSNGLSLARKVIHDPADPLYRQLLIPTRIYVKDLKTLLAGGFIKGAAHITGGGLTGNFMRILPEGLVPEFTWDWPVPEIFSVIQERGPVSHDEMRRVFNMGIGVAFVVADEHAEEMKERAASEGISILDIGTVQTATEQ